MEALPMIRMWTSTEVISRLDVEATRYVGLDGLQLPTFKIKYAIAWDLGGHRHTVVTDSCEFQGTCCMLCTCYNNVQCFKTALQFRGADSIFKLHVCSGVSPSRGRIWLSVTAADECCPSKVLERSFWVCTHTVCTLLQAHIRQQFNSSCLTVGILCNLLIMNDICS